MMRTLAFNTRLVFDYLFMYFFFFFFKQKTAYEITHSDWSSDVCSSDLLAPAGVAGTGGQGHVPEALAAGTGGVGGSGPLASLEHLVEGRLGDDADVGPGGVQLLGLGLLVALLTAAEQRRPLVADHQVVELLGHRRGHG